MLVVVVHSMKTIEGFYENIRLRQLIADIVEVKRKEMEDSDFKTFWY